MGVFSYLFISENNRGPIGHQFVPPAVEMETRRTVPPTRALLIVTKQLYTWSLLLHCIYSSQGGTPLNTNFPNNIFRRYWILRTLLWYFWYEFLSCYYTSLQYFACFPSAINKHLQEVYFHWHVFKPFVRCGGSVVLLIRCTDGSPTRSALTRSALGDYFVIAYQLCANLKSLAWTIFLRCLLIHYTDMDRPTQWHIPFTPASGQRTPRTKPGNSRKLECLVWLAFNVTSTQIGKWDILCAVCSIQHFI